MTREWIGRIGAKGVRTILVTLVSITTFAVALNIVDFSDFWTSLNNIPTIAVVCAVGAIVANALVSLVRFRTTLNRFGHRAKLAPLFVAFGIGQVSNQFLLNVIGQSLSRAAILASENIPFGATVVSTYWERLIAAAVLLILCLSGAFYLSLQVSIDFKGGGTYLAYTVVSIIVVASVTILANFPLSKLKSEISNGLAKVAGLWPTIFLTFAAHILMLAAYLALLWGIDPESLSVDAVAAILVVMFLASLPISFSGWGIRELSAAKALGLAGVDPSVAIAAAVAIGAITLVVTIVWGGASLPFLLNRKPRTVPEAEIRVDHAAGSWGQGIAIGFSILTAVLIFFQIDVPLDTHDLTVNIADPLALSSLGFVAFLYWSGKRTDILSGGLIRGLAAISTMILLSLVIGHLEFGGNSWGTTNRGLGWLFILGYVAVGACASINLGDAGRETVLRTFIIAGIAIGVVQILLLLALGSGVPVPPSTLAVPLRGYATNANALIFQMTAVALAVIVAWRQGIYAHRPWLPGLFLAIVGVVLFYSQSRTGYVMAIIVILSAVLISPSDERVKTMWTCLKTVILSSVCILALYPLLTAQAERQVALAKAERQAAKAISGSESQPKKQSRNTVRLRKHMFDLQFEHASSNEKRWESIASAFPLWRENPIFGTGLGAFVETREKAGLKTLVIHSVPVWLLAETGLVGVLLVTAAFIMFLRHGIGQLGPPATRAWGFGLRFLLGLFATAQIGARKENRPATMA
jgi:uncharacterized membrane protein YbhN (UPF0104 family)